MAKCKTLKLKHTEIQYLLNLAMSSKEEGSYYGRRDYYYKRQNDVINKLTQASNTKAPE